MPAPKGNKFAAGNPGGGGPAKYEDRFAEMVFTVSLLGATDKQLADCFGVSEQTINNWKTEHQEFGFALKRGKLEADAKVVKSLYERAMGYSCEEEKIFCQDGIVTRVQTVKHYPPDTTAMIFWLKNRQSAQWRDKQEIDQRDNLIITIKTDNSLEPEE